MKTPRFIRWLLLLSVTLWIASADCLQAQQAGTKADLNVLSLEVMALQTLNQAQFTPAQLQALGKLAPETVAKARPRKTANASEKFRRKLTELRDALVKRDAEEIQIVTGELVQVHNSDKPTLDDAIEITDAARRRAPEVLKLLTPRQVALYLIHFEGLLGDPVEVAVESLERGLKLPPAGWNELRDRTGEELGWMVAGLDAAVARKVSERVVAVLDKGHRLPEAELKKNRAELEKSMRQIVEHTGPTDVLKHFTERQLAYLLSNPQLATALELMAKKK